MSTVAVTRLIEASVLRVWSVFTDLPARVGWLSAVDAVEVVTPGPFGAGTMWRETREMPGLGPITEEFRVVECVAPASFTVASPGIGADYRMTYSFTGVEVGRHRGGTVVTVVQEGTPAGRTARLLTLVFGGLAARTVEGALRRDLSDLAAAATRPAQAGDDPAAVA